MKTRKSRSGRIIVELDGYSEGYKAYVQGAITGIISLPAKYANYHNDALFDIAKSCLQDLGCGTDSKSYYGAKIIKKADKVR